MILLLLVKGQSICINLRVQSLRTYLGLIWSEQVLVSFLNDLMINYGLRCSGFTSVKTLHGKVNDTPELSLFNKHQPVVTGHHRGRTSGTSVGMGTGWGQPAECGQDRAWWGEPGSETALGWLGRAMGMGPGWRPTRKLVQRRRQVHHWSRGVAAKEPSQVQGPYSGDLRADNPPTVMVRVSRCSQWIQDLERTWAEEADCDKKTPKNSPKETAGFGNGGCALSTLLTHKEGGMVEIDGRAPALLAQWKLSLLTWRPRGSPQRVSMTLGQMGRYSKDFCLTGFSVLSSKRFFLYWFKLLVLL